MQISSLEERGGVNIYVLSTLTKYASYNVYIGGIIDLFGSIKRALSSNIPVPIQELGIGAPIARK